MCIRAAVIVSGAAVAEHETKPRLLRHTTNVPPFYPFRLLRPLLLHATVLDDVAHIDSGSMQRTGDNVLAVLRVSYCCLVAVVFH